MDAIGTIIVVLIIAASVLHLLRLMRGLLRGKSSGCSCSRGHCSKSPAKPTPTDREIERPEDRGI